jgi:hypothetical protein
MVVKVFVLGRPGSGKTTAVRYIQELVARKGHSARRFKDYDILYKMYEEDRDAGEGNFRSASEECGGFDILNYAMFDIALKRLEASIKQYLLSEEDASIKSQEIITIEFARNNHFDSLEVFDSEFLADAYFIFLNAEMKICKKRIHNRVTHPPRPDYHFVSDYIMDAYYSQENWNYIYNTFLKHEEFNSQAMIYQNDGLLQELYQELDAFIEKILAKEFSSSITEPLLEQVPATSPTEIVEDSHLAESLFEQAPAVSPSEGVEDSHQTLLLGS